MSATMEKFPTFIQITRVSTSVLDEPLNIFFLTGVMSANQLEEVKKVIPVHSEMTIESGKYVMSTVVNFGQLKHLHDVFEPLSKTWRGEYYALANVIVDECKDFI
jgi:hypothetical protein